MSAHGGKLSSYTFQHGLHDFRTYKFCNGRGGYKLKIGPFLAPKGRLQPYPGNTRPGL